MPATGATRGRKTSYQLGFAKPKKSKAPHKRVQRPLSGSSSKVYTYRQFVYSTTVTQAAAADTLGALAMTFSQLPNGTDLAALYDSYKISYCEYTFRPTTSLASNVEAVSGAVTTRGGVIYVAVDKDDSTAPGQLSYLQEYQNLDVHNAGTTFTIRFKPGVRTGTWDGTNVVAGGLKISPWLDCSNQSLLHYGLKYGITAAPTGATAFSGWRVDLYIGIKFKNVR